MYVLSTRSTSLSAAHTHLHIDYHHPVVRMATGILSVQAPHQLTLIRIPPQSWVHHSSTTTLIRKPITTLFVPLSSSSSSSNTVEDEASTSVPPPESFTEQLPFRGCKGCGREEIERGCNSEGRIQGGIATVPGFGWWPIKAYRPCPGFLASGGRYRRQGQSMDEVVSGQSITNDQSRKRKTKS